jgi:hypothetical protein
MGDINEEMELMTRLRFSRHFLFVGVDYPDITHVIQASLAL